MCSVVTLHRHNLEDGIVHMKNRRIILILAQRSCFQHNTIVVSTHEIILSL